MAEVIAATLLLVGSVFTLIGAIGVVRMPDLMLRMHATTKAGALGAGLIALAAGAHFLDASVLVRSLSILAFVVLTAPVAAHAIGRAGYFRGVPLWQGSVRDDLKARLDLATHTVGSGLEGPRVDRPDERSRSARPVYGAPDPADVQRDVDAALEEDVGNGDLTASLIRADQYMSAEVVSREDAIICGQAWFESVFATLSPEVSIRWLVEEARPVRAGTSLCLIQGPARPLLTGERTALNFLQVLSGTATATSRYANAIAHTEARLLDTRKTLPGLRSAQKYAVRCGGGHNHRFGLYDAILIKENHIHACGSLSAAVAAARMLHPGIWVEVETENLAEVEEALAAQPDRIMLDNFSLDELRRACALVAGRIRLEASGNIDLKNISDIAEAGVDDISIGAITKHVRAIDLSLRYHDTREATPAQTPA